MENITKSKGKLEFSPEIIAQYKSFVEATKQVDLSSKAMFEASFKLAKANKGAELKIQALNRRTIEALTEDERLIERSKKICKLGIAYAKFYVIAHFEKLYFYNIEGIVALFELLEHNQKTAMFKALRDGVANCWNEHFSTQEYNNKVAKFLKEFKKDNGIAEVDGELDFAKAFDTITALLGQMDIIQLQKIAELVEAEKEALTEKAETPAEKVA